MRAYKALSEDGRFTWVCSNMATMLRGEGNWRATILALQEGMCDNTL